MTKLSSSMQVPIKCNNCGRTHKKSLSELKPNATIKCPCGTTFKVDGKGFQSAGKSLDDLQKSIADLNRKLRFKI